MRTYVNDVGFVSCKMEDTQGKEIFLKEVSAIDKRVELGVTSKKVIVFDEEDRHKWVITSLPDDHIIDTDMQLNQQQARELGKRLIYFADNGRLPRD